MIFAIRNLSVLAYAQGFTLWHYRAGDSGVLSDVEAPGFFNSDAGTICAGDMITVSAADGGAMLFVISVRDKATVSVAAMYRTAPATP